MKLTDAHIRTLTTCTGFADADDHEERCRRAVAGSNTVRRFCGRWQVLRGGVWRDLDPVLVNTEELIK